MLVIAEDSVIKLKLVQPEKVASLISVTPEGMVIELNPVQFEKAERPIYVTPEGMVIVAKLVFANAYAPIEVMPDGIDTELNLVQA